VIWSLQRSFGWLIDYCSHTRSDLLKASMLKLLLMNCWVVEVVKELNVTLAARSGKRESDLKIIFNTLLSEITSLWFRTGRKFVDILCFSAFLE